jgi:hypothetical protein
MLEIYYLTCWIEKGKNTWSLGQRRQASGYGAIDQGAKLFFYQEPRRCLILGALNGGTMYCLTPLLTVSCYFT